MENLPKIKEKKWTFFEEFRISHRETIMSEVLRYFFNPAKNHGLGDIFIKALLRTKPRYLNTKEYIENGKWEDFIQENNFNNKNVSVETEVETFNNNRIDIVINTAKLVIAIEFKINHHLDNPLNDYVDYIKCRGTINGKGNYKDDEIESFRCKYKGKEKYFVVLSPYWKEPTGKAKQNDDFVQITLASFIANVENLVKGLNVWKDKNDTQKYLYKNFVNAIKNRGIVIELIKKYYDLLKGDECKKNEIEESFKNNKLDKDIAELLEKIKADFESKTKDLLKKLKNNYHILEATKPRIESGIVRKVNNDIEYKIRLSLIGWHFEKWQIDKKIFDKEIGDYFISIENLIEEINNLENINIL